MQTPVFSFRFWTTVIMLAGTALAQDATPPVFSLASEDIPKVVVLLSKPDQVLLEVTYSKPKQAELLKMTQEGLPKKIQIALNGKVVSERMATTPSTGHSLKVGMASLDEALALAESLIGPSFAPAARSAGASPADKPLPTFVLSPEDVTKITIFALRPGSLFLDITCTAEKNAELAALAKAHPADAIRFTVAGTIIAEHPVAADAVPRALRFDMPSFAEVFARARFLAGMHPKPAAAAK